MLEQSEQPYQIECHIVCFSRGDRLWVCCSKIRAVLPKILLLLCVTDGVSSSLGDVNTRILHLWFNTQYFTVKHNSLFVNNSYINSSNMFPPLKRLLRTSLNKNKFPSLCKVQDIMSVVY